MESLYQKYGNDIEFFIVYIREVHPNAKHPQPIKMAERVSNAKEMCKELKLTIPTLIDGMENKVSIAYAGFPDRLYLIGTDGKIAFKGARGPFGFRPPDLEEAIKKELSK